MSRNVLHEQFRLAHVLALLYDSGRRLVTKQHIVDKPAVGDIKSNLFIHHIFQINYWVFTIKRTSKVQIKFRKL